jgi:hypothetical protein
MAGAPGLSPKETGISSHSQQTPPRIQREFHFFPWKRGYHTTQSLEWKKMCRIEICYKPYLANNIYPREGAGQGITRKPGKSKSQTSRTQNQLLKNYLCTLFGWILSKVQAEEVGS